MKEQFAECDYFEDNPADGEYRLPHSCRVAYTARELAV